ncbi:MAG: S41 family peptidase [Candidatus Omnitrophota bacterium]
MKKREHSFKVSRKYFFAGLSVLLVICAFSVPSSPGADKTAGISSLDIFKQVQMFADAISLINSEYVKEIEVKQLIHGAIRGMMKTLDGYSQFLDEAAFKDIREETKGEFGGIGVEIGIRDGVLTVITPIAGTPASESGIESGDKVVKIDGDITRDLTLDEAVRKLRGEAGTEVSITVMRDGGEMLEITLTRAVIKLKSVKVSKIISGDIAYIKLVEFQERTAKDIDSSLTLLKEQGASALILDLRNNPGGLLDSAIELSDKFLAKGELIVYTEGRDPEERTEFFSTMNPEHGVIDIIALVNKGSASAAEILAGALQDNKRALLLGETTFGKGSVQTVISLRDNSALRLTTAAYYTPSGRNLMDKGIEPDIYVAPSPRRSEKDDKDDVREERSKLFEKVEEVRSPDPDDADDISLEPEMEDEQILAAVNILKGVRMFENNKRKFTHDVMAE